MLLKTLQTSAQVPVPSSSERELVGIWLRPLGNAAYVACLLLLCQGSKWPNGKHVTGIRKVLGLNPSWILNFISGHVQQHYRYCIMGKFGRCIFHINVSLSLK